MLNLSAINVAGSKHRGKRGADIIWHGTQNGTVCFSDRNVRVKKPRLRRKGKGTGKEVEIPAYESMNAGSGNRILDILMRGVSTRNYHGVIPEMAETVGVSKSTISREFVDKSGIGKTQKADRVAGDALSWSGWKSAGRSLMRCSPSTVLVSHRS